MNDERDEIRARINIVELVGSTVALKRAGKHFKGLCPFHQDRNPSFYVDPMTGRYRCWSCGEAGDIFTWVMKTQNVDFAEALKDLARQAGVTLQTKGPTVSPSQREAQRGAMEEALIFFRESLSKSTTAQQYCSNRSIDGQTIEDWEIGYAPDVRESLTAHLKRKGVSLAEAQQLFLVDGDPTTGYQDKFFGRLMFPIRDERGELVAFGGRILGDGHPKYINSSDTPLFRKSRILYGMHRARNTLSKEKRAVLVEGYLDVIACHRAGVTNAIASLGTSLTEDHGKLLKRWVDEVVILYDGDAAGQKAADRAIGILRQEGLRVKVALMPEGDDPDTLLRKSGPLAVQQSVEKGVSPQQYRIAALERRLAPSDEAFWEEAVSILAESSGDLETESSLVRLAGKYPGTQDVAAATKTLKRLIGQRRKKAVSEVQHSKTSKEYHALKEPMVAAEIVVFRSMSESEYRSVSWGIVVKYQDLLVTKAAQNLAQAIADAFPNSPPMGPVSSWISQLSEEAQVAYTDILQVFVSENLSAERLSDCYAWLKREKDQREVKKLTQEESLSKQEILQRLRQLKPDSRAKKQESDDSLF